MNAQSHRSFATVTDAVSALIFADDDFAKRAALLLAAYEQTAFHADAITGTGATSPTWGQHYIEAAGDALCAAKRALVDAMDDIRVTVAREHGLWRGDAADLDMMTTRKLIAEHGRRRGRFTPVAVQRIFAPGEAEGRN